MIKRIGAFVFALTLLFAFAVPASAAVPSGYTELEYIESTGTQYIDTGYVFTSQNIGIDLDFQFTDTFSGSSLFGSYNSVSFNIATFGSPQAFYVGSSTNLLPSDLSEYVRYSLSVQANNGVLSVDIDGTSRTSNYSGSLDNTVSFPLFAYSTNGSISQYSSARFYSCKIYDNGTVVRDFVPVKTSSSVGLYDSVTGQFFDNSGSGSFIAGPVVDDGSGGGSGGGSGDYPSTTDYVIYESLTSSGSQYFDTGVPGSNNLRVVMDFSIDDLSTSSWLFGSSSGSLMVNDSYGSPFTVLMSGDQQFQVVVGDETLDLTSSFNFGGINSLDLNAADGTVTLNGSTLTLSPSAFDNETSIYLFGFNSGGTAVSFSKATIYSCKMYYSGSLIRSFYPASNSSGAYGFYDDVESNFSYVIGSGVASPGDVLRPPEEETVADVITDLNNQIHEIESTIYEDLHTYSAQVDPSTATNFSGNFLSAMSFISDTWTSAYNQLGDMQVVVTFPLFLAIAMLFIGRMNSVIASGAMKSRKNNDKKGGGDVG